MPQTPNHPSFPRPKDENIRLWRYMSFDRFKWLVEKKRLYMSQPAQLEQNDRFEGTMPKAESAWWDEIANQAGSQEKVDIIKSNKKKVMGFIRAFRTGWFVSCWHMSDDENYAFWEIYGKCAMSIAIVTTFAKLESQLPNHVHIGCVRYVDYESQTFFRDGGKLSNLFDYIMHKRSFYRYEEEVRAVASAQSAEIDDIRANIVCGSYAPIINPTLLINEIVVHPRAPRDFLNQVRKFCRTQKLPHPRLSGLAELPVH